MQANETALARIPVWLLDQVAAMGLDRELALHAAGITKAQLVDPDARLQLAKVQGLWQHVLEALPDPDLGLRLGSALRVRDVGLVGYTMLNSATAGGALERLVRFYRILDNSQPVHLRIDGKRTEFYYRVFPFEATSLARMLEFDLVATVGILREITGTELAPLEVRFSTGGPSADPGRLKDYFRAPIEWECPSMKLIFARDQLELPVVAADEALGSYLDRYAQRVVEGVAESVSLLDRVERATWVAMKRGRLGLEGVAAELAMSPRSLQRQLKQQEGTTFSELLADLRRRLALDLLEDQRLAIYEIAFLLGYSEPSTFYRAFRRWHGASPREYRRTHAKWFKAS